MVLPTPPLGEKTVISLPGRSVVRWRAGRAGQRAVDLAGPLDGLAEPGEVALLDDLAHAGPQRLGEHAGVDAAAQQDHAGGRLG